MYAPHKSPCLHATIVAISPFICSLSHAQWSDDPAANLAVVAAPSEQVLPKIAHAPDGSTYIGWFSLESGNYNVYLQRLDQLGNKTFAENGLLVSDNESMSFIVDWDLTVDSSSHAIVTFADVRTGGDLDIYAYRISPAGDFVWGPDGVAVSDNADFEPAPRVCEASDGDIVVTWARLPDVGDGKLLMQRITPGGKVMLTEGGMEIAGLAGESPAFNDVMASDGGSVIVSWVRDISTFQSPRHLRTQKFDAAGARQWGIDDVVVYDTFSLPIAYTPVMISDDAGGAIYAWYVSTGALFSSYVQHINSGGAQLLAANGLNLSTSANQSKLSPTVSHDSTTDEIYAFYQTNNSAQSQWGLGGQKISAEGARAWSDSGVMVLAQDTIEKTFPRSVSLGGGDGALVFLFDKPTMSFFETRVIGLRIDADGASVWPGAPIEVCSTLSGKDDLVIDTGNYPGLLAWEDERNDGGDIYAQNIDFDGSLGTKKEIPGDLNGDGSVGPADLAILLGSWGPCPDCPADLNGDGSVGPADLAILLGNWG